MRKLLLSLLLWSLTGCGLIVQQIQQHQTQDPKEILALVQAVLPGAQMPKGYRGDLGQDMLDQKVAMWSSQEKGHNVHFMLCSSKPKAPVSARDEFRFTHTGKVLQESTVQMAVGKKQVEFKKYLIQDQDGSKSLSYVGILDGTDGRYVQLVVSGPQKGFDRKAFESFLRGLKVP